MVGAETHGFALNGDEGCSLEVGLRKPWGRALGDGERSPDEGVDEGALATHTGESKPCATSHFDLSTCGEDERGVGE